MIMRIRLCLYILLVGMSLHAQKMLDTSYFDSPIKHDIILAGSFGELRATHFHAGLDIKPSKFNKSGDSLFVAAPGYISRIKIQTGGYGRVLYVDHPNGYTSVYAHMFEFQDSIEEYIQHLQLASQSYEIDIYPQKEKLILTRGAFIGFLGNSGRSYGAHLHFEIRNTKSETPINPLLFGIGPKDNIAPDVASVSIHGLSPDHQQTHFSNYPTQKVGKGKYTIGKGAVTIPAWRIGVLLQGWDRMDGASNKNGIYKIKMSVDDTLRYGVTVDSVNWDETAYIKTHIDYADKKEHKRTAVRCYPMPGNLLNIYDETSKNGIISIFSSKPRKVEIEASDFSGNTSKVQFDVSRSNKMVENSSSFEKLIKYDQAYNFKLGSCHMTLETNALDRDLYFNYSESRNEDYTVYSIHKDRSPLYKPINITIPIISTDSVLLTKLCAVLIDEDGDLTYKGGVIIGDSLNFNTKVFGDYSLYIDTIPPNIIPRQTSLDKDLSFTVKDNISDVSIDTYIDGQWIISPFKILDHTLVVPKKAFISGQRELTIIATDEKGNKSSYSQLLHH